MVGIGNKLPATKSCPDSAFDFVVVKKLFFPSFADRTFWRFYAAYIFC